MSDKDRKLSNGSINKLGETLLNIYTFDDLAHDVRFKGSSFQYKQDPEDDNNIILTLYITVEEGEFGKTGEFFEDINKNLIEKKTPEVFTVKKSEERAIDINLTKDTMGIIIDENNKRKTHIESALYYPTVKFYKDSIRIVCKSPYRKYGYCLFYMELYKRTDKTKERIEDAVVSLDGDRYIFRLSALLKYYNLYNNSKWLKRFGVDKNYSDFISDTIDDNTDIDFEDLKNYTVSDKALIKLQMVSKGEFVKKSNYIDSELLDYLLASFFKDIDRHAELDAVRQRNCDKFNVNTPLDFSFMGSIDVLCMELQKKQGNIRQNIKGFYTRKKKNTETGLMEFARNLSPSAAQNAITAFYHMQADDVHDIQAVKDSNTVTMLTQEKTIYFFDHINEENKPDNSKWWKQRIYNKYFIGVLDPVRTRDGPLINKNNEFADCVRTENNGDVLITVYNMKTHKDEELRYEDFVLTPILTSDCYDWRQQKIIKNKNRITILRYSDYEIYENEEDLPKNLTYVRKLENLLSTATSIIPFTNRMVPTRTLLASHFLDQSIPIIGARPSVVHTKKVKEIYQNNPDNVKLEGDLEGVVLEVKDQYVKIRLSDGKIKVFEPKGDSRYRKTSMSTTNEYVPQVVKGQKVKPGTVLITSNSFYDGEFTTMVPLYVAFGTYQGREHEDGIILTESAAAKFTHISEYEIAEDMPKRFYYSFKRNEYRDSTEDDKYTKKTVVSINPKTKKKTIKRVIDKKSQDNILRQYNLDEWSLVKKGSSVTAGSLLFEYYSYDKNEVINGLAGTISTKEFLRKTLTRKLNQIKVPYNVRDEGIVKEVALYINKDSDLFDEGSYVNSDDINLEMDNIKELYELAKEESTPPSTFGIDAEDNLEAFKYFKKINETREKLLLDFKEERKSRNKSLWTISDSENAFELRITIQYADKISNTRLGAKLSNFYASKGVNVYVIPDEWAPKDEFGNTIEGFISTGTTFSRQNPGQIDECRLGLIGWETWKRIVRNGNPNSVKTKKILDLIYPYGWDWKRLSDDGKRYGYCRIEVDYFDKYYTHTKIEQIMKELGLDDGNSYITLPEYGEGVKTENKCTVGVTSMMRLHFIQEHKMGITADLSEETYSDNLTYAHLDRDGGQKMGQMEMMAGFAHGLPEVLQSIAIQKDTESKGMIFSAALMMMGMKLQR